MDNIAGKAGMLRFGGYIEAITIAFVNSDPDTITDSGNGFLLAGFRSGDKITVSGSTSNDGTYTIASVTAGTITLDVSDSLVNEDAGDYVIIKTNAPGPTSYGIRNFSLNYNNKVEDISTYDSVQSNNNNERDFISTTTGWTLTFDAYYDTGETNEEDFVGRLRYIYIFPKYAASPSNDNPAYYYHGVGIITGITPSVPVETVVEAPGSVQGIGSLSALVEKKTSW